MGEYRSLIGQLNWIETQTRADIAFEVCALNAAYSKAKMGEILKLNKVIRDTLDRGELRILSWMAAASQLAECLTRKAASTQRLRVLKDEQKN